MFLVVQFRSIGANELITEYNHLKRQTNKYKLDPEKKKELLKLIDKLKI